MTRRLLVGLMLLLSVVNVNATVRTLEVEFVFTPPDDERQVTSFRLYQDASLACDTVETSPGIIECAFNTEDGTYNFTLTAAYDDATESPSSPIFTYNIADNNSGAASYDGNVEIPSGQVCINYNLANIAEHGSWSSVNIESKQSRLAVYGVLGGSNHALEWDNPGARQICWNGTFPALGVVQVRLVTYRGAEWQSGSAYQVGDEVTGELDGYYYVATVAGTAGGAPPTWPIVIDSTVTDGDVTWQCKAGANNWSSKKMMRMVYLKSGDSSVQKSSTHRVGGNYGIRAR